MYRDPETYQGPFYVFHKEVPCRDMLSTRCFTPAPCDNRICLDFPVQDVLAKSLELLQLREGAFRETPP